MLSINPFAYKNYRTGNKENNFKLGRKKIEQISSYNSYTP
ncbi:hypothetical protein HMPREF1141_1958 [Clostridium sp. MSTE9]|nr:hypothetical protein HMPREF1141_1958 [Clostridium sp. MSTE9]